LFPPEGSGVLERKRKPGAPQRRTEHVLWAYNEGKLKKNLVAMLRSTAHGGGWAVQKGKEKTA